MGKIYFLGDKIAKLSMKLQYNSQLRIDYN
jgi:hypothetical protein